MVSFILGLAVTAALFYISALYKSASLLMFGYAGAGLLILAALFLSYRMHTIQCGIAVPISIAEAADGADSAGQSQCAALSEVSVSDGTEKSFFKSKGQGMDAGRSGGVRKKQI